MGYGILSGSAFAGLSYINNNDNPFAEWAFIIFPVGGFALGGLVGAIHGDIDTFIFPAPPDSQKSKNTVSVEISSIVEQTGDYIIVKWQTKEINLLRSEYNYIAMSEDGEKIYIILPTGVYNEKFK